jgi:hypothetical protein
MAARTGSRKTSPPRKTAAAKKSSPRKKSAAKKTATRKKSTAKKAAQRKKSSAKKAALRTDGAAQESGHAEEVRCQEGFDAQGRRGAKILGRKVVVRNLDALSPSSPIYWNSSCPGRSRTCRTMRASRLSRTFTPCSRPLFPESGSAACRR